MARTAWLTKFRTLPVITMALSISLYGADAYSAYERCLGYLNSSSTEHAAAIVSDQRVEALWDQWEASMRAKEWLTDRWFDQGCNFLSAANEGVCGSIEIDTQRTTAGLETFVSEATQQQEEARFHRTKATSDYGLYIQCRREEEQRERVEAENPAASSTLPNSIAGAWHGNGQSTYTVAIQGSNITWEGRGIWRDESWHHRGEGAISDSGHFIDAVYTDEPDSAFYPNRASVSGILSLDGSTITWSGGFNPLESVWRR